MFTISDTNYVAPAFLSKLWEMVNDEKYDDLIQWHNEGSTFIIKDPSKFCSEVLPVFYKHNNMASFIRQLNKYGFRKVVSIDSASLKNDKTELEFSHPYFLKDHPLLIFQIKRKTTNTKEVSYSDVMTKMAKQVQQLQHQQTLFKTKLSQMDQENSALWKEYSLLRYKHQQLQSLINKLIQFLIKVIQQSRGFNIKRVPTSLMIKHSAEGSEEDSTPLLTTSNHAFINPVKAKENLSDLFSAGDKSSSSGLAESDNNIYEILQFGGPSSSPTSTGSLTNCAPISVQEVSPSLVRGKYSLKSIYPKGKNKSNNFATKVYSAQNHIKQNQSVGSKIVKPGKTILCKPTSVVKKPATSKQIQNAVSNDGNSTVQEEIISNNRNKIKARKKMVASPQIIQSKAVQIVPGTELILDSDNIIDQNNIISSSPGNSGDSDKITIYENSVEEPTNTVMDLATMPIVVSPSGTELSLVTDGVENTEKSNDENNIMAVDYQWDEIKSDLDVLKDILQGDGFSIDTSQLFGLFNNDDPLSLNLPADCAPSDNNSLSGNELISYNSPSFMDILDGLEDNENDELQKFEDQKPVPSPSLDTPKPIREIDFASPSTSKRRRM